MPSTIKLHQLIAIADGKSGQFKEAITKIHHSMQKDGATDGFIRSYRPLDEEDPEKIPSEKQVVQFPLSTVVKELELPFCKWLDILFMQTEGNTRARGSILINDQPFLENIPVSFLLFLETRLNDIKTVIDKMPILDLAEEWDFDSSSDLFVTETKESIRTKKTHDVIKKSEATDKHPAQTEIIMVDKTVGYWDKRRFSGAIPQSMKYLLLNRVSNFRDAVKKARESANSTEIQEQPSIGQSIWNYIFGDFDELKSRMI